MNVIKRQRGARAVASTPAPPEEEPVPSWAEQARQFAEEEMARFGARPDRRRRKMRAC